MSIRDAPPPSTSASAITGRRCLTVRWWQITPASGQSSRGAGEPAADFLIDAPSDHGLPGLVHLFGIESPGLTSALALADDVVGYLSS